MSRCRCQAEARPAAVAAPDPGADLTVVVVAAGSGERFGHPGGKALVEVAGRPLVAWSRIAAAHPAISSVVSAFALLVESAARNAAFWVGDVSPLIISFITAYASS